MNNVNGARLGAIAAVLLLLQAVAHAETDLSFSGSPVIVDGNGVDTGSIGTTARWSNVGTLNGTDIDLVIEVISNNRGGDSMQFTTDGDDAAVWLDGASGQIVELDYNFFEAGTSTPITIIPEALIQDLDSDVSGTSTLEIVRVLTSQIANYTVEASGPGSDLTVTTLDNGTPGDSSDDEFEVTSGADGNPGDTNISIEFDFQPLPTIRLVFETANGASGRQFSFDGNADSYFTTPGENKQDMFSPVAPTIALLATNDATPTLTGTAEAFSTMTVVVGGATFEVVAASDGTWSLDTGIVVPESGTFNPNIDGTTVNEVIATSADAAGNTTNDVSGNELYIDATPPFLSISTTGIVNAANEASFSFHGTCTNGDGDVTVSVAGASPPSMTAPCSGGTWISSAFDLSGIADGSSAVVVNATQTDAFGNTGNAATVWLDKDSTPPGTPTVDALTTSDTTPVITGTADAGAAVSVTVGGATYTVSANGSGQWSLDTGLATPDSGVFSPNTNGANSVTATVTDVAGNSSTDTTDNELVIDTVAPAAPTVASMLTNDPTPTVTGTAEVGTTNTITFGGATFTVATDGFGQWSLDTGTVAPDSGTFSPDLNGSNDVTVLSTDAAGNSAIDASLDEVTIDTTDPVVSITSAPVATSNNETSYAIGGNCEAGAGNVTASILGASPASRTTSCLTGTWTASFDVSAIADGDDVLQIDAVQTDAAGNTGNTSQLSDKDATRPTIAITNDGSGGDELVSALEATAVVVAGTSDVIDGRAVTVTFSDGASADVVAGATVTSGTWTASAADISSLNDGTITISADVSDAVGNSAVPAGDVFTLDTTPPVLTVDTIGVTNNTFPTFSGTTDANAGNTVTIRDGLGAVVCTATVISATPTNTWSCTSPSSIPEGVYVYTADITDVAGNVQTVNVNFTVDLDFDNDGIPDAVEGAGDTDGDGTPDFMDTDSDNDGIPDLDEEQNIPPLSGIDTDGDGIDNAIDVDQTGGVDANGDGVDDALAPSDQDADGIPDYVDDDTDGDGIADATEGAVDSDADGTPDYRDLDSDNDAIPDALENFDSDGDGIDDYIDPDSDNDGIPDSVESNGLPLIDTDGDGVPDHLDPDSDNDGISDLAEGQTSGNDVDNDGIDDTYDVDQTGGTDLNGDGVDDAVVAADFDNDGVPNYLDLDSDNDGRLDVSEGGLTDANEDGIVDDGAITDTPPNSDGTDGPDFIDLDSDGDGTDDIVSSRASAYDGDGDGQIDPVSAADVDGDGVPDVVDGDNTGHGVGRDFDNDGVFDPIDLDDDSDGIPDDQEMVNGIDVDTDMDGIVDRLDLDSDNDGLPDSVEAVGDNSLDSDRDGLLDDLLDSDADGLADQVATSMVPLDTDGDGTADFRDIDSDGDGMNDIIESARDVVDTIDANGDGVLDSLVDADGDGLVDIVDPVVPSGGAAGTPIVPPDTDGDGSTDQIDFDSDSDGILDVDENGDFNGDGIPDSLQVDGPLQTAVTGGGAVLWLPAILLGFAIASRCRRAARTVLPLMAVVVLLPVAEAKADEDWGDETLAHFSAGFGKSFVAPEGYSNGWHTVGDTSDGYKLRVGYRFSPRWFAEVSYVDAGEAEIGNRNPGITDVAAIRYQIPAAFVGFNLRQSDDPWKVHVKLGVAKIRNESNDDRVRFDQQSSAQAAVGITSEWNVTRRWFYSFEYEYYSRDASFASFNIGWRFAADF
ncbi:MAG: Ig-like domain-containing protein [Woeseiaceae bacterium]|nr:Ig-like domain-containing protein [Woeseiaceae bacterium]